MATVSAQEMLGVRRCAAAGSILAWIAGSQRAHNCAARRSLEEIETNCTKIRELRTSRLKRSVHQTEEAWKAAKVSGPAAGGEGADASAAAPGVLWPYADLCHLAL
jgi:hypothetical protein